MSWRAAPSAPARLAVRPELRLLPRLACDRLPRAAACVGLGLLLLAPVLRSPGPGSAGDASGPLAALLVPAAVWLAAGTVSGLQRDGAAALWLVRPVSRAGLLAARYAATLLPLLCVAAALCTAILARAGTPAAAAASGLGSAALAASAAWLLAGGLTVLCSALLERDDGLLAALLLFAPLALEMAGVGGEPGGRALTAVLPPTAALLDVERALLGGAGATPEAAVRVAAWGTACLAAGLAIGARRGYRPA